MVGNCDFEGEFETVYEMVEQQGEIELQGVVAGGVGVFRIFLAIDTLGLGAEVELIRLDEPFPKLATTKRTCADRRPGAARSDRRTSGGARTDL